MSTEEAVTDALQKPIDQNAESAEQVKKMLAELEGNAGAGAGAPSEEEKKTTNGPEEKTTDGEAVASQEKSAAAEEQSEKPAATTRETRSSDRRHHDRSERGGGGGGGGRGRGRGGGRGGFTHRNYRDNIKSDLTSQEESSDPVAIRKQVEFYFSDSNLPKDQFLFRQVGGSSNNPVELKVLHSFKRMRHFQPFEAIVEAMKESKFLELTDDNTCVRRREPLPEGLTEVGPDAVKAFEDRAMPRSVYAKGFGEEVPSTQFDIEAFFAPYGPTNAVRLRRSDTKLFKGSVFVEFENEDLQKAFLALDPKPRYQEKELQIMSKKEYCDKKVEDIKSGKIQPNKSFDNRGRGGHRGGGGRDFKRKRDNEDDRDWRERRDEDRKNGHRDDKRKFKSDRDSRGGKSRYEKTERDDRGVPVVKTTTGNDSNSRRDAGRADALAKARAIVEAENKKKADKEEEKAGEESTSVGKDAAPASAPTAGTKRAREDDQGDVEREVKKIDSKPVVEADAEPVNGN